MADHTGNDIIARFRTQPSSGSRSTIASNQPLTLRQLEPETASVRNIDVEEHPNTWSEIRYFIREPAAEFLGTMVLIMFGMGVDCQVTLSASTAVAASQKGSYETALLGWGIGAALGVWTSAGISGGHINPAVTLAQVVFRRFPLRKFFIYALAQVLGAFTGALIIYGNYSRALDEFEGGRGVRTLTKTAPIFITFPLDYVTDAGAFFSEALCTAILLIVVFAVTDKRNSPPPDGLVPLVIFFVIVGVGAALGMQTAFAMNPARDLGPRLMTAIFYGREVWTFRRQYWLWTPILGPFCGALMGAGIYDLLMFTGSESRINRSFLSRRSDRSDGTEPPSDGSKTRSLV